MSIIHYIDNEVAGFGEWDAVIQTGSSTIVQTAEAAFPERGSVGLQATKVNNNGQAYCRKYFDPQPIYYGLQIKVHPGWIVNDDYYGGEYGRVWFGSCRDTGGGLIYEHAELRLFSDGTAWLMCYPDQDHYVDISNRLGDWIWYVRTVGGGLRHGWVDGVKFIDVSGSNTLPARLEVGVWYTQNISFVQIDIDEIKIANSYPEPFVPTPRDEYPSNRRTVILFRQGDSDSREFANYCVEKLGIPRANLCPLPNASGNETLVDYPTFQAEVENDLSDWLNRNPTVKSNCTCFLIGFGVPGYFYHNGNKHSATSRLMNFGATFSSASSNPLYKPAKVSRLTKSDLSGKYLSFRIDADTLQNAKAIIDRSLSISALSELPSSDVLFCADNDYCTSLACQHLRITTNGNPELALNDAFFFGFSPIHWDIAGTRAAIVDDSVNSANTMRATSKIFDAIVNHSYAGGSGCADDAETFDAESFFEMLRIGGTLAEAIAVAVAHLDYTAVAIGNPLMTVAFRKNGYNIYKGVGGVEHINWDNPVAYLRAEQQVITFKEDLIPCQQYIYAVRAVSSSGIVEHNTNVITYVEIDKQGNLSSLLLAKPINLDIAITENGIFVVFSYYRPIGFANPDKFEIIADFGDGQFDLDNPIGIVEPRYVGQYDFDTVVAKEPLLRRIAVRACKGECTGPLSNAVIVPPNLSVRQVKLL